MFGRTGRGLTGEGRWADSGGINRSNLGQCWSPPSSRSAFKPLFLFRGGVGASEEPRMEYLFLMREKSYWVKWRFTTVGVQELAQSKSAQALEGILGLVQEMLPEK